MQMRRSPDMRPIDPEWHRQRQEARERAYSGDLTAQFSDEEIIKYDLETAQIDGSDNPRVFMWRATLDIFGINGTDIRDLKNR